jgi:hypothetical protein
MNVYTAKRLPIFTGEYGPHSRHAHPVNAVQGRAGPFTLGIHPTRARRSHQS